jgi:two-component system phosphate regulon sensor histidine kinase PhoR
MRTLHLEESSAALEAQARVVIEQLRPHLLPPDPNELDRSCKLLGALSGDRITVIALDGAVLGDSDENPALMENHRTRPEIARAYEGRVGMQTRFSNTLQKTMVYVAVPVYDGGEVRAVVRTSYAMTAVEEALDSLYGRLALGGLVITALATIVSLIIFRRLVRPLQELQKGAERFSEGHLTDKLPPSDTEEIAVVSESMNRMAASLDTRIRTVVRQRNESEAILSSMSEGIIALDANDRIVVINGAAAELLKLDRREVVGQSIYEVVRIPDLHELVETTAASSEKTEKEIILSSEPQQHVQIHGTALLDAAGARAGIVLVLTDITRVKKLEEIRRDFVANVSHELKTPITAITGSAETLLDGTTEIPGDGRRFLDMIVRHARRLGLLVEDLLDLARLDTDRDEAKVILSRGPLEDTLQAAVATCREQGRRRGVSLTCRCGPNLEAEINGAQLERAVTNLIDNAIKQSDSGSEVIVSAASDSNEIVIAVEDSGCGIEGRHLPRLFERFYRVDSARSRESGGTGLGLAIVKHVAMSHRGRVSVESVVGKGSTFRIHLPLPA